MTADVDIQDLSEPRLANVVFDMFTQLCMRPLSELN